jgi:hypothetical protein
MSKRIRGGRKIPMTEKLRSECKEFNKGLSPRLRKSLEEFARYKYGYSYSSVVNHRTLPPEEKPYQRPEQKIESKNSGFVPVSEQTKKEYTGDVVIGVGVAHKSNLTPIINKQQAEDLASMRR